MRPYFTPAIFPICFCISAGLCAAGDGVPALISSDAVDSYGETIGGIGSAVEFLDSDHVVMLSDRGPGDGTVDYRPRLQVYATRYGDTTFSATYARSILLTDAEGRPFTGLFPDSATKDMPRHKDGRICIDPEGLAVASDGRFLISEEYSPGVFEFSADGKFIRRFQTPDECVPRGSDGVDFGASEVEDLRSGREPNRGFEGLTLMPGEKTLATILQSGLVQDGTRASKAVRIYLFDVASGKPTAAYAVPFADLDSLNSKTPEGKRIKQKHLVFSSIAALPDGRLLALERENFGADGTEKPDAARYKAIVILDLEGADDILGKPLTTDVKPVSRKELINLAELEEKVLGVSREQLPAKWEGIAIKEIKEGKARLLLASDNDFLNPTLVVDRKGLHQIAFPKAIRSQATHLINVEVVIPPAH